MEAQAEGTSVRGTQKSLQGTVWESCAMGIPQLKPQVFWRPLPESDCSLDDPSASQRQTPWLALCDASPSASQRKIDRPCLCLDPTGNHLLLASLVEKQVHVLIVTCS